MTGIEAFAFPGGDQRIDSPPREPHDERVPPRSAPHPPHLVRATAVGPDGQVMVTYQDQTTGQGGSRIYTALDPDGLGPAGFTDPRLLARSRVGGFDYLPVQPNRSVDAEASLAWDRSGDYTHAAFQSGRFYPAWSDNSNSTGDNPDGTHHQLDLYTASIPIP